MSDITVPTHLRTGWPENLPALYDYMDNWLKEFDTAPDTNATRLAKVEIKLLKCMVQYAPIVSPEGTSPRGQEVVVAEIVKCEGDRARLKTLSVYYRNALILPSQSTAKEWPLLNSKGCASQLELRVERLPRQPSIHREILPNIIVPCTRSTSTTQSEIGTT